MINNSTLRELPLSHLVYQNSQIDAVKANDFVVYHYPLMNSYDWKEKGAWETRIDAEVDSRQFAYLMKKNGNQFGLFVALQRLEDVPPVILDSHKQPIPPERVYYASALNPVWIRLMMRSLRAFGGHCKGAYSLGCPLLKVDSWANGVNAISLDCKTQQLKDGETTEIALFTENVPLRPVSPDEDVSRIKKPLWVYDKNKVLVRWYPGDGSKPKGTLFKEIPKHRDFRKQRAFLDLSSPSKLEQSWPMILKPVQDEFIRFASQYGFTLTAKTLRLKPLALNTKYKANKSKPTFPSINVAGEVKVLDLRVNTDVTCKAILDLFSSWLFEKGISVSWQALPVVDLEHLTELPLEKSDRLLILIDQGKGVEHDRYALTTGIAGKCAIQHINVNPYDVTDDPVEMGLLIESARDDDPIRLYPTKDGAYYKYGADLFDSPGYKDALTIKLEVVLKELELKRLLLDPDRHVSQVLPLQRAVLNESVIVITDGCLFTIEHDRPIVIPFDPTDDEISLQADGYLVAFGTSINDLLEVMNKNWPYSYRPEVLWDHRSADPKKFRRFVNNLTFVLSKRQGTEVSILMQDPSYDKTNILPLGMDDVLSNLRKKQKSYPIEEWMLPNIEVLCGISMSLCEEGIFTSQQNKRFLNELPIFFDFWQEQLLSLLQQHETKVTYQQIKKDVIQRWLDKQGKAKDTAISGSLDTVLSRFFDKPLNDIKRWMTDIPGIQRLWYDEEQGYFIVGGLTSPKNQLARQPSIRQWHALQGMLDVELLSGLLDVDWVRMNQLAGNPCVATLVKRWKEIQVRQQ